MIQYIHTAFTCETEILGDVKLTRNQLCTRKADLTYRIIWNKIWFFPLHKVKNSMVSHYRSPKEDSTVQKFEVLWGKGWRSGESARLPPMWPGFKSRRRRHMWVEFVVGSLLCSERFFSGYSGFPLSSKTSIFKFQFDQELGRRRTTLWMCYLQIVIIIIIIIIIIINTIIKCGHRTVYTAGFLKTLPPNQSSIFSSVK